MQWTCRRCRHVHQRRLSLRAGRSPQALVQVPGGKVIRVETGSGGAAYEVHMTKADGSRVVVTFDKTMTFIAVRADQGRTGLHHGFFDAGGRAGYPG